MPVEDEKVSSISHNSGVRELTPELKLEFTAIAAMDRENGLVKAENVLKRAESPQSALHKFFTWDNDKAADSWRLMEARYLIRSFKVEVEPLVVIPAFVSLGSDRTNGGGYRWSAEVLPQVDLKRNLILTVLGDIENLLHKLDDMPEMQPLRELLAQLRVKISQ